VTTAGQRAYNGVALLSRMPPRDVVRQFATARMRQRPASPPPASPPECAAQLAAIFYLGSTPGGSQAS